MKAGHRERRYAAVWSSDAVRFESIPLYGLWLRIRYNRRTATGVPDLTGRLELDRLPRPGGRGAYRRLD